MTNKSDQSRVIEILGDVLENAPQEHFSLFVSGVCSIKQSSFPGEMLGRIEDLKVAATDLTTNAFATKVQMPMNAIGFVMGVLGTDRLVLDEAAFGYAEKVGLDRIPLLGRIELMSKPYSM